MNTKSFKKWQGIANEFLSGNLNEVDFCKGKQLDVTRFRHQLHEVERFEEELKRQEAVSPSDNLFVELIPQSTELSSLSQSEILHLNFRGATFELVSGFSTEVFREALQIVKEVI
ncbi:MAG: hypothetical protein L3J71_13980 [Victivallaceae bacterium]|nr:hypothetical protein [Victivallaceae bacterium]